MKKIELNKIYNVDCLNGMSFLSGNKIDLIITDPPFAIDFKATKANYNRTASRVIQGYNEINPEDYYDFTCNWMEEAYRILKESGNPINLAHSLGVNLLGNLPLPCEIRISAPSL